MPGGISGLYKNTVGAIEHRNGMTTAEEIAEKYNDKKRKAQDKGAELVKIEEDK